MTARRIFILTGAGISAESGLSTFRDKGGVWSAYTVEEVASIQGYERNPSFVLDFYNMRRNTHKNKKLNETLRTSINIILIKGASGFPFAFLIPL